MKIYKSYAKINLLLDILRKLPNGYHEVEMIMHRIDLYDNITIKKIDENKIILANSVEYLPTDEKNIAYKAALLMKKRYKIDTGYEIYIEKNIPVAAGLAGGSSNAATVMMAIKDLENLDIDIEELMEISLQLGADVPFCILGGCALAKGIGEKLTSLNIIENMYLVLCKPNISISTKKVYELYDSYIVDEHPDMEKMLLSIKSKNIYKISENLGNVLENVTIDIYPEISKIKSKMLEYGAINSMMSGSGPTVFGIFKSRNKAEKAFKNLKIRYKQTYISRTI